MLLHKALPSQLTQQKRRLEFSIAKQIQEYPYSRCKPMFHIKSFSNCDKTLSSLAGYNNPTNPPWTTSWFTRNVSKLFRLLGFRTQRVATCQRVVNFRSALRPGVVDRDVFEAPLLANFAGAAIGDQLGKQLHHAPPRGIISL